MHILTINTGSSSIKAATFDGERRLTSGQRGELSSPDAFAGALAALLPPFPPAAAGHRIVAPLDWKQPQRLTPALLRQLRALVPLAPDHLPQALAAVEAVSAAFPSLPQVLCSDSAFHHSMPEVARRLPLPALDHAAGVELARFGYHGLSCEYIASVLEAEAAADLGRPLPDRLVIAHLGHGSSLTAVRAGQSLDTTMGFTPLSGLVMSTRTGDLDPGVLLYLLRACHYTPEALSRLLNQQSGLAGISGLSGDMQTLLASKLPAARAAVASFAYSARKHLGALAFVLGGVDLIVFTGGIGEHADDIRRQIAGDLPFRVIATDEERMLARHTARLLGEH
ncbi:MAG: acetate/propionate family kinase [Terriglobales bacterium]